jgi:hypothetical protein
MLLQFFVLLIRPAAALAQPSGPSHVQKTHAFQPPTAILPTAFSGLFCTLWQKILPKFYELS